MNREQKMAWMFIVVFTLAVAAFAVAASIVGWRAATGFCGLFGLAGFGPVVFRKRPQGDIVDADERDKTIIQRSTLAGAMSAYMAVGICCMVPWFIFYHRGNKTIPVDVLPLVFMAALVVLFVARSITLLVLYSRNSGGSDAPDETSKTR